MTDQLTPEEEHIHNQNVLKAMATFYAMNLACGNTQRAQINYARYMQFLREFVLGINTDNV